MTKENKSNEDIKEKIKQNIDEQEAQDGSDVEEKTEVEKLKEELEETKSDYLRARADFENYRKRSQEELAMARDRAINSFVQEILPAIDNFEMSLKMTDNKEMFIKGVEMIHGNLLNTLKEHHFEEYEPQVGEEFDPDKHEPVLIEAPDKEEGKVLGVIQKGYLKKDSIVRPARVQLKKVEEDKEE